MPIATIDDVAQDRKTEYAQTNLNRQPLFRNDSAIHGMSAMDRIRNYVQSETYRQKQKVIDQKIRKLIDYGYDQRVKKKVAPTVSEGGQFGRRSLDYSHVDDNFGSVAITSEALKKGNYISRRVVETANLPLEAYLFSLDNKSQPGGPSPVVRDLYIARDQEVTPSSCHVPALAVIASSLDIRDNLKKRIVGWSHSHGHIHPFFSDDDKENIRRMLGTSTLKKRIRIKDPMIRGKGYKGVEYEVRYVPAIVFNAANAQPFVAIAVEYTRRYDGQRVFHINEGGSLRVIDETNGIDMDPGLIDRQILERVSVNSTPLLGIYCRRIGRSREDVLASLPQEEERPRLYPREDVIERKLREKFGQKAPTLVTPVTEEPQRKEPVIEEVSRERDLEKRVSDLETEISQYRRMNEESERDIRDLQARVNSYESTLRDNTAKIERLNDNLRKPIRYGIKNLIKKGISKVYNYFTRDKNLSKRRSSFAKKIIKYFS